MKQTNSTIIGFGAMFTNQNLTHVALHQLSDSSTVCECPRAKIALSSRTNSFEFDPYKNMFCLLYGSIPDLKIQSGMHFASLKFLGGRAKFLCCLLNQLYWRVRPITIDSIASVMLQMMPACVSPNEKEFALSFSSGAIPDSAFPLSMFLFVTFRFV